MKTAMRADTAAEMIPDGGSVPISSFMAVGSPHRLSDALVAQGTCDLTVIANNMAMPGRGKLIRAWAVSRLIASHIGLNLETQAKMIAGEIEVELVPQGTLVERIRAGGVSLGGVLTETSLVTPVEVGKRIVEIDSARSRLEKPLRAHRRASGRLYWQPSVFPDCPQLQSDHGSRRRPRDCRARPYRARRGHFA